MAICEASGCMKKNGTRPEKLNDLPFQEAYFFLDLFSEFGFLLIFGVKMYLAKVYE